MAEILPDGSFQGYTCPACNRPCGMQGHLQVGEQIDGVWVRYEDHEMGSGVRTCDADYAEKAVELRRRVTIQEGRQ